MKAHHAAVLALVGWYLMVPPTSYETRWVCGQSMSAELSREWLGWGKGCDIMAHTADLEAPLREWHEVQPFERLEECQAELDRQQKEVANSAEHSLRSMRHDRRSATCALNADAANGTGVKQMTNDEAAKLKPGDFVWARHASVVGYKTVNEPTPRPTQQHGWVEAEVSKEQLDYDQTKVVVSVRIKNQAPGSRPHRKLAKDLERRDQASADKTNPISLQPQSGSLRRTMKKKPGQSPTEKLTLTLDADLARRTSGVPRGNARDESSNRDGKGG